MGPDIPGPSETSRQSKTNRSLHVCASLVCLDARVCVYVCVCAYVCAQKKEKKESVRPCALALEAAGRASGAGGDDIKRNP